MRYNFYKYSLKTGKHEELNPQELPTTILDRLNSIESEIVLEYLKKQKNRPGIKKLGIEIRNNQKIKAIFSESTNDNKYLIKLTAHYHSYLNTIVDSLNQANQDEVFFFVLESIFRQNSNLVDSSSRGSKYVIDLLSKLAHVFEPNVNCSDEVYIIEMKGFSNYYPIENVGYTKLEKRRNV